MCALKFVQAVDLPEGEILTLRPGVVPLALAKQLDLATASAEDGCLAEARSIRDLTDAISGEPGKNVSLFLLEAAAPRLLPSSCAPALREPFRPSGPLRTPADALPAL